MAWGLSEPLESIIRGLKRDESLVSILKLLFDIGDHTLDLCFVLRVLKLVFKVIKESKSHNKGVSCG